MSEEEVEGRKETLFYNRENDRWYRLKIVIGRDALPFISLGDKGYECHLLPCPLCSCKAAIVVSYHKGEWFSYIKCSDRHGCVAIERRESSKTISGAIRLAAMRWNMRGGLKAVISRWWVR